MKAAIITNQGLEKAAQQELKELLNIKGKIKKGIIIFNTKDLIDLCLLTYRSQTAKRIILIIDENLEKNNTPKLKDFINEDVSYAVRNIHTTNKLFTDQEIGERIFTNLKQKFKPKINLKHPQILFLAYYTEGYNCLGIDFSGFDLTKRPYRVFAHPREINPNILFGVLKHFGWKETSTTIQIPCFSGGGIIEQALAASYTSPWKNHKEQFMFQNFLPLSIIDFEEWFNKLESTELNIKTNYFGFDPDIRNYTAAKKNAKIAGVSKMITLSRLQIDWLDTKFEKNSVDFLLAMPKNKKEYKELNYQAKFIMKNTGKIILINPKYELENYKKQEELEVLQGKRKLKFILFKKKFIK